MERIIKLSKWVLRMSSEHALKDVKTRKAIGRLGRPANHRRRIRYQSLIGKDASQRSWDDLVYIKVTIAILGETSLLIT